MFAAPVAKQFPQHSYKSNIRSFVGLFEVFAI
jgi:hypothetical protein